MSGSNEHFGRKKCEHFEQSGGNKKKCFQMNIFGGEEETLKKCLPGKHLMGAPVPTAHT